MIAVDISIARLEVASSEDGIRALAAALFAAGHVKASFEGAALARERRSPTGLPFPGVAVALPHAEPDHVVRPAIAIASLVRPVTFRQMGSPAVKLEVSLVVMPALTAKEQAASELSRLIQMLQDEELRRKLVAAADSTTLAAVLRGVVQP